MADDSYVYLLEKFYSIIWGKKESAISAPFVYLEVKYVGVMSLVIIK